MTEKGKALWILALLSPVIAEMLSGSSPPFEFFNPLSFALLLGLYGAGVVLVRELTVIWNKGWASVIAMGAAYGILEEGVAVKSFFDPNWMDLGGLGEFGRYLGTNWVWAVWLTIFHSAISIALPIFLIAILYPHLRGQRFLTRRRFETVLILLFLDVLVCTTLLNSYVPLVPMYLLSIGAVFFLVYFAKHLPKSWLMPSNAYPTWSPRRFAVLGFVFLLLCFVASGIFVGSFVPFLVPIVIELVVAAAVVILISEHIGTVDNLQQRVGFASGILSFFVFVGMLLVIGGGLDMIISVVGASLFIIDLTRWSRGKRPVIFRVGRLIFGDSKTKAVGSPLAAK